MAEDEGDYRVSSMKLKVKFEAGHPYAYPDLNDPRSIYHQTLPPQVPPEMTTVSSRVHLRTSSGSHERPLMSAINFKLAGGNGGTCPRTLPHHPAGGTHLHAATPNVLLGIKRHAQL